MIPRRQNTRQKAARPAQRRDENGMCRIALHYLDDIELSLSSSGLRMDKLPIPMDKLVLQIWGLDLAADEIKLPLAA